MAVDFGVGGLMALLALLLGIGASLVAATRRWPTQRPASLPLAALAVGVFGSLLALAVHGMVDAPHVAPRGYALIFALFGVAAALSGQLLAPSAAGEPTGRPG